VADAGMRHRAGSVDDLRGGRGAHHCALGAGRVSVPTNCIKCEHVLALGWQAAKSGDHFYACKAPGHGWDAGLRTLVPWRRIERVRITPPSWCPLKREGTE
jgi:hypothetical protein